MVAHSFGALVLLDDKLLTLQCPDILLFRGHKLEKIFHLIYISDAYEQICYSDIHKILDSSKANNLRDHLTGLLIYKDHYFLQILEGNESTVLKTMGRIIQDRRNRHVRVLVESQSNQRIFENWGMAFHDGDIDRSTVDLMSKIFETALNQNKQEKETVLQMLQCFRRSAPLFKQA